MAAQNNGKQADQTAGTHTACFLCAIDSQACAVPRLEGRMLTAFEHRHDGANIPVIVLADRATRVELHLTRYQEKFVRELQARGAAVRGLTARVYHLPTAAHVTENNGRILHVYNANSYTLVVLEPDLLLNITDLSSADYCSRQYLLQQLIASPPSPAIIRGNLVHYCFRELLKEQDDGRPAKHRSSHKQDLPLAILERHFEQALAHSHLELALAGVAPKAMRESAAPHLQALAAWYEQESASLWDADVEHLARAETYLLAPEIGLRGRLDILWQQSNRRSLLELKTGGKGVLPKTSHRRQVEGYHALLAVRRESKMQKARALLLYSGTPEIAQAHPINSSIRDLQHTIQTRNILVLSSLSAIPPAPPGASKCSPCVMRSACTHISSLLDWQPPTMTSDETPQPAPYTGSDEERAFFAHSYALLQMESREIQKQQAMLWQTPVAERVACGTAIQDIRPLGAPQLTAQGEWEQTFQCDNTSELREGDQILLSDGDPICGEVVTGTIQQISAEYARVWTPERIAHPALIDRHDTSIVHARTMQNLLRWLRVEPRLRALVAGRLRPTFSDMPVAPRANFNEEQNLAVSRALQMQDYLLIQGPPGTGKTAVIAEIVTRLARRGQRVLLAAFTNQAVDTMLKRLDAEGFHDYIRLGHERSVHSTVRQRLLQNLLPTPVPATAGLLQHASAAISASSVLVTDAQPQTALRELVAACPVVASTTATWSSDRYDTPSSTDDAITPFSFDVAIIDEASQVTVPAMLGALRFARRFILVGDEKQLPPVVLSQQAAAEGLAQSLFSQLKSLDADYTKHVGEQASACVSLRVQYRMNQWISNFASRVFYDGRLVAAPAVAKRVLPAPAAGRWMEGEAEAVTCALRPEWPLVFLDAPVGSGAARAKSSDEEALLVRAVVAGLLARGIEPGDIGIIAPYRAQVAALRRRLFSDDAASGWAALPTTTSLSVDTVDRFQGGERMVMMLSFATSLPDVATSQLGDFLANPNRLNVALTRAQRKLILVGCAAALDTLPYFQRLLAYCRSMNTLIEATSM